MMLSSTTTFTVDGGVAAGAARATGSIVNLRPLSLQHNRQRQTPCPVNGTPFRVKHRRRRCHEVAKDEWKKLMGEEVKAHVPKHRNNT
jgi:hypothetical protein